MKVLVVGGGGREHAIIKKLKESKKISEIYALPGNGGMANDATCVAIGAKDISGIVNFALENKIDYAEQIRDEKYVFETKDLSEKLQASIRDLYMYQQRYCRLFDGNQKRNG